MLYCTARNSSSFNGRRVFVVDVSIFRFPSGYSSPGPSLHKPDLALPADITPSRCAYGAAEAQPRRKTSTINQQPDNGTSRLIFIGKLSSSSQNLRSLRILRRNCAWILREASSWLWTDSIIVSLTSTLIDTRLTTVINLQRNDLELNHTIHLNHNEFGRAKRLTTSKPRL
ncbi:hypothetical protein G7K_2907-t1 [Saitoella complicata NRRL Y-17804]|uniref:Uncharacterized protein n=1 Tax=Saitoella complicata (strain BCRC 22490 / CBS 7301 / JCM 7358 / NBRC 10748 / NRRL Y-17804) TaxID=698492 RepID=A0A0E9NFU1_SAICN|nr:hypothetical protein G7K_2907-t1 [Saitoella complicata NRRL Y-17804]